MDVMFSYRFLKASAIQTGLLLNFFSAQGTALHL